MRYVLRWIAILAMAVLSACAGAPTKDNIGYVYAPTVSSCREGKVPNDTCVAQDLRRCIALVDFANPGRDETTFMAIVTGLTTLFGTAITYSSAGFAGAPLEAVTGTIIGSSLGTGVTYNKVLYRSAVEACMFSYGRDPKLTEQYFGLVKYSGKVEQFTKKP